MTSITEGSPQVIKEALACGCPIVSVDVGDVKLVIDGVDGCYIARREINAIAEALKMTFDFSRTESGRNTTGSLVGEYREKFFRCISLFPVSQEKYTNSRKSTMSN